MVDLLQPAGYAVHPVIVNGCLHLKSAVTQIRQDAVLVNPAWVVNDTATLSTLRLLSFDGLKAQDIVKANAAGEFSFRSYKPKFYSVPDDGPSDSELALGRYSALRSVAEIAGSSVPSASGRANGSEMF